MRIIKDIYWPEKMKLYFEQTMRATPSQFRNIASGNLVREIEDKDIDLIQCTGLKDKHDKLIYEGDIVKIFHVSGTMQGKYFFDVVEWNDLRCRFDTENYGIINDDEVYEAIGNVYQHEYLLKEYNL